VFGREAELPTMLYFEFPFEVLEQGILGRARYSGRADDNVEAMRARFDTFKAETLPTVELFRSKGKCVEIDTRQDREAVYALLRDRLAEYTEQHLMDQPLTEKAEILLGLRPYARDAGAGAVS
jgi:UMP-CMP kinase